MLPIFSTPNTPAKIPAPQPTCHNYLLPMNPLLILTGLGMWRYVCVFRPTSLYVCVRFVLLHFQVRVHLRLQFLRVCASFHNDSGCVFRLLEWEM